MKQRKSFHDR